MLLTLPPAGSRTRVAEDLAVGLVVGLAVDVVGVGRGGRGDRWGCRRGRDAERRGRGAVRRVGSVRLRARVGARRDLDLALAPGGVRHLGLVGGVLGGPRGDRLPLLLALVDLALELVNQQLRVVHAALRDRLGERGLVGAAELADLQGRPLDEAGQADAREVLVGAAEDGDVPVLVDADVVLALVVLPETVAAAADKQDEQDKRCRHDGPAALALRRVIVVLVVAVMLGAVAAAPPAPVVVFRPVLVLVMPEEAAGPVEGGGVPDPVGARVPAPVGLPESTGLERLRVKGPGVAVTVASGSRGPDAGRRLLRHHRLRRGPAEPHGPGRRGTLPGGRAQVSRGAVGGRAGEHGLPRRRDPAAVRVDDIGHDAGDVVGTAALDGELDEPQRGLVRVPHRGERLVQRLLGHHAGQAVGAQQEAVTRVRLERRQVGLGDRPAVKGAEQQRPVRVRGHVVLGDLALVDQRLDERVIMGDLDELAVAQQVGPGVADMAECRVPLRPQQRGQRRAHALDRRVGDDQFLQAQVRRRDRVGQRANKVGTGIFRVERCDRRNGGSARHLTGRVASHAVGNREQVRSGVRRVFVPLSEETDIGPYRESEG